MLITTTGFEEKSIAYKNINTRRNKLKQKEAVKINPRAIEVKLFCPSNNLLMPNNKALQIRYSPSTIKGNRKKFPAKVEKGNIVPRESRVTIILVRNQKIPSNKRRLAFLLIESS
jgi:hypothetical protein